MVKEAKTSFPVHELVRKRWSARSFSEKPLTTEVVHTLIEAASWAPSSLNEQPWHYSYALKGTPGFDAMWACLLPGNQPWAKDAAVLVLSTGSTILAKTGQANRHFMHDCGMANAILLLQATSMGFFGHTMGGYDRQKTRALFNLPDTEEDICMIAFGYLDTPEKLTEPFKTREVTPRQRKPLEQISADVSFTLTGDAALHVSASSGK
ncbi:nitroreductase family protein [Rhodocytophaga rosea]|uniref:Nitroreductase family protein n=1 Tax=Rhodocytophaga rosea TaxID=2704465 RepID=A0A6C0GQU9_9BACT|nr:nitroreductase family protein [Rhodocytophaga rosea]QHT70234.1 nitroreductase family protein [Rhodocytophaga rosea]